jgi:hydrogenase maturation protease
MTVPGALVIAYGNPLREDDGVAWAVAAALEGRPGLEVRTVHQLVPELAEALRGAATVVFVDADRNGPAGRVRRRLLAGSGSPGPLGHALDPARLLGLCASLYARAPRATLVSVAGARFGFGGSLSRAALRAVPAAVRKVLEASRPARRRPS